MVHIRLFRLNADHLIVSYDVSVAWYTGQIEYFAQLSVVFCGNWKACQSLDLGLQCLTDIL